jgi:5-methylcytosine-specific restriction protein A
MPSSIQAALLKVLREYPAATAGPFGGNPLADYIRNDLPAALRQYYAHDDRYIWQGGPGQGVWARAPWVAVFDVLVTDSVQSGYYPVYLFREDMSGVYLSLNQGVTEIRGKYKSKAKDALQVRAADFLAQVGGAPSGFEKGCLDLRSSASSNLSAYYGAGNIFSKFYPVDQLPEDAALAADLRSILSAYELLSYNETVPAGSGLEEDDERGVWIEDLRAFRQHKRIERNARLSKEAKKIQGYSCKLCGFNFKETYGEIGNQYIEAHHLTPVSELKGKRVLLDPAKDFAVLCANCHRMVHRCESPHDMAGFKEQFL